MSADATLTYFPEPRPAVMVVSHERSGTHFLMNALAACYGYVSQPRVDLDMPTQSLLELHSRAVIRQTLTDLADRQLANLIKSHHHADFFSGELAALTDRVVVFVIYRDPMPVLVSFWRYMFRFGPWENPGPQVADPVTFARSVPSGRMLRYQTQPCASVIERWASHVESWLTAAAAFPRVRLVRYEGLDADYEATLRSFADLLGRPPQELTRPARDYNVIPSGPADPMRTGAPPDLAALRRLCAETAGATMRRLGYC